MREIKFRAWDGRTKLMWEVYGLSWCDPCFIVANPGLKHMDIQDRDSRTKRVPMDIELMQYTGLKDKNGKEIYEGDIIRTLYNPKYVVSLPDYFIDFGYYSEAWEQFPPEVIGNIYENPELTPSP